VLRAKPETILKRFDAPDDVRVCDNGRSELIRLGCMAIGRTTYQPGWKWSADVGPGMGATCSLEHVGMVLSGCATAAMDNGAIYELRAGTVFYIRPDRRVTIAGS
jgi:hypothetical protein